MAEVSKAKPLKAKFVKQAILYLVVNWILFFLRPKIDLIKKYSAFRTIFIFLTTIKSNMI
jgi:hypothetical protein